jgi:low affinity sulfate transporter 2
VDFFSHAAIVGFMAGAALIIGLQQLKGLLGFTHFTTKTDLVSVLESVFRSLHTEVSSAKKKRRNILGNSVLSFHSYEEMINAN